MKYTTAILSSALLLPAFAVAQMYDTLDLPYSDAPEDLPTAIAISTLTSEGIVEGNPDGTFRPNTKLNRAEFTKIAMVTYGVINDQWTVDSTAKNCFPDVGEQWFAQYVCSAKELGIVSGNAVEGVPEEEWLFAPERNVQYIEALKILALVFGHEVESADGDEWYVPYVSLAEELDVALPEGLQPGHLLTRGEMSRLAVRFYAYDKGELDDLIAAQSGEEGLGLGQGRGEEESVQSSSSSESSESSSSSSEESSSSSAAPVQYDTNADSDYRAGFILLGKESQIIGAAKIFSETQPIIIDDILVRLTSAADVLTSFSVYLETGELLGYAYRDSSYPGNKQYTLSIKNRNMLIPKEGEISFYVRANTRSQDQGGESGDIIEIDKLGIVGIGDWNNKEQTALTSEDYVAHETARARITKIDNPQSSTDVLIAGSQVRIGSFRLSGETDGHGSSDLAVTDLTIRVDQTGGVTLSNVYLLSDGTNERIDCTNVPGEITCSSIPASHGSFEDASRTLRFYADVSITGSSDSSSLQLRINDPGSATSPGDITWTDGEASHTWIGGDTPIVRGTFFSR